MHAPKHYLAIIGLLVLHFGLLVDSAYRHSPTWDEVGHLAAGLSHWEFGRFELYSVNPPLVRTIAAVPVHFFSKPKMDWSYYRSDPTLRSEVYVGRRMIQLNGKGSRLHFFLARLAVIPVSICGAVLSYLWSRRLFGEISGVISLAIWCLSPNILAYGSVFSPDLASAVSLIGCCYLLWRWIERPNFRRLIALSFAVAAAMLVKSVWLALPVAFVATNGMLVIAQERAGRPGLMVKSTSKLVAAFAFSLLLVNGFYGFAGSFRELREFSFCSDAFTNSEGENRFAETGLGQLRVPLPANYLRGIDVQTRDFERGWVSPGWKSYLGGEWKAGGWLYYYPVGLALKVPLGTWCLVGFGTLVALFTKHSEGSKAGSVCLVMPSFLFFVAICSATGLNRYVRYALPFVPVLFIWASQVGRLWSPGQLRWRLSDRVSRSSLGDLISACRVLTIAAIGWLAFSMGVNSPHHLSYFNELAGGASRGHEWLCDSNIDWGQDLFFLQQWLEKNPGAAKNLHLAYFGSVDPVDFGIQYELPPYRLIRGLSSEGQPNLQPGWYVISKNYVVGHSMPVPGCSDAIEFRHLPPEAFQYFDDLDPCADIGGAFLVYMVK